MTPEAAAALRDWHERCEDPLGDFCAPCGANWPCTTIRVLDLLPAAGEALVLGPEGWERVPISFVYKPIPEEEIDAW